MKINPRDFLSFLLLLPGALLLSGCVSDKTRQAELCAGMARHYAFQQQTATSISPAEYIVCGNAAFPCAPVTPANNMLPAPPVKNRQKPRPYTHARGFHPVHHKPLSVHPVKPAKRKCTCHCVS